MAKRINSLINKIRIFTWDLFQNFSKSVSEIGIKISNNILGILAIPITILSVIVTFNADLINTYSRFDEENEGKNYLKLISFDKLLSLFTPLDDNVFTLTPKRDVSNTSNKQNKHIYIFDRTLSIQNEPPNKFEISKHLIEKSKITYKTVPSSDKDTSINQALFYYHMAVFRDYEIDTITVFLYNGRVNNSKAHFDTITFTKSDLDVISRIKDIPKIKINKQNTYIRDIIETIGIFQQDSLHFTIISDFEDDDKSYNYLEGINKLLENPHKINKINIIFLPRKDMDKYIEGRKIVDLFRKKFQTIVNFIEIDINQNIYNSLSHTKRELEKTPSMIFKDGKTIKNKHLVFYFPKYDTLDNMGYKRKIIIGEETDTIICRFTRTHYNVNEKKYHINYTVEESELKKKGIVEIDKDWIHLGPRETLVLNVKCNSAPIDGELMFEVNNGKGTYSYPVVFTNAMIPLISNIGKFTIMFLYYLIIYALIAHAIMLAFFSMEKKSMDYGSLKKEYHILLLLWLMILGWFLYLIWDESSTLFTIIFALSVVFPIYQSYITKFTKLKLPILLFTVLIIFISMNTPYDKVIFIIYTLFVLFVGLILNKLPHSSE